jgi:hypothetical protein
VFQKRALTVLSLIIALSSSLWAQGDRPPDGQKWVATWAASVHGPYPSGNPSAQPDLKFAFPDPAVGTVDQSFRLIVKPDLWGDLFRIRLANTFGTQPVTFDAIYVGVSSSAGAVVKGTISSDSRDCRPSYFWKASTTSARAHQPTRSSPA